VDYVLPLSRLNIGQCGIILSNSLKSHLKKRLTELGFTTQRKVCCVGQSPVGDPKAYLVCGAVIALRDTESSKIYVKLLGDQP